MELVIVMAITACILSIAIWAIGTRMPDLHLKAAARALKSDMHSARMAAIQQNTFVVSRFDTMRNQYVIYIDNGAGEPSHAHNYIQDAGEETIRRVDLHPDLNMIGAQFGAVTGMFAFNSRGAVDGLAGGIYLSNKKRTYRGVTVSRIGKITLKESKDGRTWDRIN